MSPGGSDVSLPESDRSLPPAGERGARPDGDGFIFHWERQGRVNWRLAFVLIVSFAAHLFGFYLFTVAYRPAERILPKPARVQLLSTEVYADQNSPERRGAAQALARLRDRLIAIQPSTLPPAEIVALDDFARSIRQPSIRHQLRLRGLPSAAASSTLPTGGVGESPPPVFDPERVLLPPVSRSLSVGAAPDPVVEQRSSPDITLEGNLAGREVLSDDELWTSGLRRLAGANRFRFQIGVDRQGHVIHALVMEGADSGADGAMLGAVRALRFKSDPSSPRILWGILILQW